MCKIIDISRPSLNKWIDDELISKGKMKEVYAGNQSFDLKTVLEGLIQKCKVLLGLNQNKCKDFLGRDTLWLSVALCAPLCNFV